MTEKSINKFILLAKKYHESNLKPKEFLIQEGLSPQYFYQFKSILNRDYSEDKISDNNYIKVLSEVNNIIKSNTETINTIKDNPDKEEKYEVNFNRDENGKIKDYSFKIYKRDKPALDGTLSREEMNSVYRLYSYYGASLTQRIISRNFPEYSLIDFKRILRAFNITKASAPFAPHMFEEKTEEELNAIQYREKENDFLRKVENRRFADTEKMAIKFAEENAELKKKLLEIPNFLNGVDLSNLPKFTSKPTEDSDKSLIIWLSDMHIGATVSEYSDYTNIYDENEVNSRLDNILYKIINFKADNIYICNLGDSIDGMDNQTCRRDHYLPQNMDNKKQATVFIKCMTRFFNTLIKNAPAKEIYYYCVGSSNHGGDYDWMINYALGQILEQMNIKVNIANTFMSYFKVEDNTFILCHGKDSKDMKANLPLTLNDKTINYINQYIAYNKINNNVVFVKGDLHQSATSYCNTFKYKSVSSLFGSSEWIHKNFGNSCAACDYSIVDETGNMLDGRIVLN